MTSLFLFFCFSLEAKWTRTDFENIRSREIFPRETILYRLSDDGSQREEVSVGLEFSHQTINLDLFGNKDEEEELFLLSLKKDGKLLGEVRFRFYSEMSAIYITILYNNTIDKAGVREYAGVGNFLLQQVKAIQLCLQIQSILLIPSPLMGIQGPLGDDLESFYKKNGFLQWDTEGNECFPSERAMSHILPSRDSESILELLNHRE